MSTADVPVDQAEVYGYPAGETCSISGYHAPRPSRFVHHHVFPLGDGGPNVAANRIEACDNCHYAVHELLDLLRIAPQAPAVLKSYPRGVRKWAVEGWKQIQANPPQT